MKNNIRVEKSNILFKSKQKELGFVRCVVLKKIPTKNFVWWNLCFDYKSNEQRCSIEKLFIKLLQYSHESPVLETLLNKVTDFQACNFIEKRLQHRFFPVYIVKFLRKHIVENIFDRLLLWLSSFKVTLHELEIFSPISFEGFNYFSHI